MIVASIIGTDRFTAGYDPAKIAHERAMLAGPVPVRVLRAAQFHELVAQLVDWGTLGEVAYVPRMRTQLVAARAVAEVLADLGTAPETVGAAFSEVAGPREESMVEMAAPLAARRGHPSKIEGVSDPSDPDRELNENGALTGRTTRTARARSPLATIQRRPTPRHRIRVARNQPSSNVNTKSFMNVRTRREKVRFISGDTECAAWHYPGTNGACVIMAGGGSVAKEPGTDLSAKRFHEAGSAVLAFDYRRLGGKRRAAAPGRPHQGAAHRLAGRDRVLAKPRQPVGPPAAAGHRPAAPSGYRPAGRARPRHLSPP